MTACSDTICSFEYSDGSVWPDTPDGKGNSLVPTEYNPENDQDSPEFWRASVKTGGSPGYDDKMFSEGKSSDLLTVYPNYPNPFLSATTIRYELKSYAHVTITIINASGQQILVLEDRNKPAGTYTVEWNGTNSGKWSVAAGLYFYRIRAENTIASSIINYKMLKIR